MKNVYCMFLLANLTLVVLFGERVSAKDPVAGTLRSASDVLEDMIAHPAKCIPPALVRDAKGVAIIPGVIKVGLGIGGRHGEGIVLGRNPDGSWCNPVFISLTGGSIGWQAGVQSADVVLIFRTRKSLERLLEGKGKLTLGADAAVAAGPIGRQAEADTDVRLRAEIYSYSRARGLFAGLALEGAAILQNGYANEEFTKKPRPEDLVAAGKLKTQLMALSGVPVLIVPRSQPIPPRP